MIFHIYYYSTLACESTLHEQKYCPERCGGDYITTMQDSYGPPEPFCMKRLSMPIPPFLKYRKLAQPIPEQSENKFYDEDFIPYLKKLQEYKASNFISFNPMTGKNSDGSDAGDKERKCVKLEYDIRDPPTKCYNICPQQM